MMEVQLAGRFQATPEIDPVAAAEAAEAEAAAAGETGDEPVADDFRTWLPSLKAAVPPSARARGVVAVHDLLMETDHLLSGSAPQLRGAHSVVASVEAGLSEPDRVDSLGRVYARVLDILDDDPEIDVAGLKTVAVVAAGGAPWFGYGMGGGTEEVWIGWEWLMCMERRMRLLALSRLIKSQ